MIFFTQNGHHVAAKARYDNQLDGYERLDGMLPCLDPNILRCTEQHESQQ
jgi:hypothetical protein